VIELLGVGIRIDEADEICLPDINTVTDGNPSWKNFSGAIRFRDLARVPVTVRLGRFTAQTLVLGILRAQVVAGTTCTRIRSLKSALRVRRLREYRMRDEIHPVKKGDLFVARPGEEHEIISSRKDALGIYFWGHTLHPQRPRNASGPEPAPSDDGRRGHPARCIHALIALRRPCRDGRAGHVAAVNR